MKMRDILISFIVAIMMVGMSGVLATGCSGISQSSDLDANGGEMNENQEKHSAYAPDERLVAANRKFGFNLYRELLKESGGDNIFVSPSSVGFALAMTHNGAAGETKRAMENAMAIAGLSPDELNAAYAQLRERLEKPDPRIELQIANSLWAREGIRFREEFLARNKKYFEAEVATLDFASPSAVDRINSWVSDNTKGKIPRILEQIGADAIMYLINAIYFKGAWTVEFDRAETRDLDFTRGDGTTKKHPMMARTDTFRYLETPSFQAIALPYGEEGANMYVFLPAPNSDLKRFHGELTAEKWDAWLTRFDEMKGDIVLPRFRLEYKAELKTALSSLGMAVAFDRGGADFSAMLDDARRAYIEQVVHKTFVEVNEEGTEAAAATSVEIGITSAARPQRTFRMVVDRPFFFAIVDNQTESLLFMGSVTNPL